jgi:hypothetical protein
MGIYAPGSGLQWIKRYGKGSAVIEGFMSRESLVLGTYNPLLNAGPTPETFDLAPWYQVWPETNRVGVISADSLTTIIEGTGQNFYCDTPGQVFTNTIFACAVNIRAAGIVFMNCLFLGPPSLEKQCVVATNAGANPTTYIDCTFVPQSPNRWASGWIGSSGKSDFKRCDFYAQSDAITPGGNWSGGVTVLQSAFHDMIQYGPDPGAAGGIDDAQTHVDQTQFVGGKCVIRGSGYAAFFTASTKYMEANQPPLNFGGTASAPIWHFAGDRYYPELYTTSAIMMSPATYPLEQFEMTDTWIDGGAFPINCAAMNSATIFKFNNNHVGNKRSPRSTGSPTSYKTILARASLQANIECVGNVSAVDGSPLTKAQLIQNGA